MTTIEDQLRADLTASQAELRRANDRITDLEQLVAKLQADNESLYRQINPDGFGPCGWEPPAAPDFARPGARAEVHRPVTPGSLAPLAQAQAAARAAIRAAARPVTGFFPGSAS